MEVAMLDFIKSVVTIAAGVLVGAGVGIGIQQALKPASTVTIDMTQYECQLNGPMIECRLR